MKKFILHPEESKKSNVISFKSKKHLSEKQIKELAGNDKTEKPDNELKVAESPDDIPDDSLMLVGVSGNQYAISETAIRSVISREADITQLDFYDDFLPTILNEWLVMIPEE